ncbi:glycosyltransferase [Methanobacterium sp.]|uniref:glycosyltransferase n=1 Tax=Methanobacterium sp. TaxID=2164 RepID=UPI003C773067
MNDSKDAHINSNDTRRSLGNIHGIRGIFGIIITLLYLFLTFIAVKLLFGSFEFATISLIPWMTILVDGGDRVIRYFIEFKKQIKRVIYLKKTDKSIKTLDSFISVPRRYSDTLTEFEVNPYAIIMSVYNIENDWDYFKKIIEPWKNEVYIVDDNSSDKTRDLITAGGFNLIKNPLSNHKPYSIRYGLSKLPSEIKTVMVIDPDVEIPDRITLERAIFDFQRSKAAACGLEVLPSFNQDKNMVWTCQMLEYEDSMSLGRIVPHNHVFTSGASALYKRDILEEMLKQTSLSMYAEDMEISIQLISSKLRTYFDKRVTTRTLIPPTLKKLTLQRMSWSFGQLKVTTSYFKKAFIKDDPFFIYNFYIYNFFIIILMHPLRVISIIAYFISLGAILLGYFNPYYLSYEFIPTFTLLFMTIFFVLWSIESIFWSSNIHQKIKEDKNWNFTGYITALVVYAFYRFYLILIPNTLGYLNFISFKLFKRMIFKDAYQINKYLFRF